MPNEVGSRQGDERADRMVGALLGTALGDALGLVAEGMSGRAIARRFGRLDTFRLLPGVGVVSDDTEQAALVASALAREPEAAEACARLFRRSLVGWFWRLPWGIGLATLRACLRGTVGLRETGIASAGNGAAMRAPIIGVFFADDDAKRHAFGDAIARITHTDPRGVQAALFAAEISARVAKQSSDMTIDQRATLVADAATAVVSEESLRDAIARGSALALAGEGALVAGQTLGNTGFVLHTLPLAAFCFVRSGHDPLEAIVDAVAAGGDADTTAAIVGAWVGALHGSAALPPGLVRALAGGPFGERHLRSLAHDLATRTVTTAITRTDAPAPPLEASFSVVLALLRNLALFPVVLFQALRTLVPR